jgi:hypothetical protein
MSKADFNYRFDNKIKYEAQTANFLSPPLNFIITLLNSNDIFKVLKGISAEIFYFYKFYKAG